MSTRDYRNKVVVITGSAGGLGQSLCRQFLSLGAKVAACDLKMSHQIQHENIYWLECDVTQIDFCEAMVQKVNKKWGKIDVLVNNAGISHQSDFRSTHISVIDRVMRVNFYGSMYLTKLALEDLISTRGQIIVVSSIAGFSPLLDRTGYSASKHALHGFFDSLRAEIESLGVRVSIACPSFVATGIEAAALGGSGAPAQITRKTVGRESTPDEMAQLIIEGARREQDLILPTKLSKISWWVSRFSPRFFKRQMKKKVSRSAVGLLLAGTVVSALLPESSWGISIQIRDLNGHQALHLVMVSEMPALPTAMDSSDHGFPKPGVEYKAEYWLTRFTDRGGRVDFSNPRSDIQYRVRKLGYKDQIVQVPAKSQALTVDLEKELDANEIARQKPASSWLGALKIEPVAKKHFRMQCGFCHQQGNDFTRVSYDSETYKKTIARMVRYGSRLPTDLQKTLAHTLTDEWARLQAHPQEVESPRALDSALEHVTIKEWPIGTAMSQTHDQLYAESGLVYVADNIQDRLWEVDPVKNTVTVYKIPHREGEKNGGLISGRLKEFPSHDSTSNAHSLAQSKVDGHIFITPSAQRRLVEFDPKTKKFELHEMAEGFYPHTIRIDDQDRVWFTLALSNQVARFDRASRVFKTYDLPARGLREKITTRYIGALYKLMGWGLPLSNWLKIDWVSTGVPLPYGIEVTPDQKIWFTRLHTQEIGSIDPQTDQVEMIGTPFLGPRRLRTDNDGKLWITSYGDSLISKYDPMTRQFKTYDLPVVPAGNETPYALNVDRKFNRVWVTGNQSNAVMSLDMKTEKWTVVPMPRKTTFTRDFEFSPDGLTYTSNSNFPSWHVEGAQPTLIQIELRKTR